MTRRTRKEEDTARTFGGIIKPVYTIKQAVEDHAVVPLLGTLRDVKQRKLVVLVVTLYAKESHIGMILRHLTGQRELAKHLKSAILHTIDSGPTRILKADEIVVPNEFKTKFKSKYTRG